MHRASGERYAPAVQRYGVIHQRCPKMNVVKHVGKNGMGCKEMVWSVCVTSSLLQKMRPDAPFIFDVVYVLHLNKSP